MNKFSRESALGGRNVGFRSQQQQQPQQQPQQLHGRGGAAINGGGGGSREGDESLDLFSKIQHNKNVPLASEQKGAGSPFLERSKIEDFFSADSGKSDYDWLLTPPGTPIMSSSFEVTDHHQPSRATPRNNSNSRPASTAKASRFSPSQSESNVGVRPAAARSSISNTYSASSYVSNCKRTSISNIYTSSSYVSNNARTSVLNTSTSSVTSKPSPTIKSSRSTPSRSPTPVKAQPSAMSPGDTVKTRARPSTASTGDTVKTRPSSMSPGDTVKSRARPSTASTVDTVKTRPSSMSTGDKSRLPQQNSRPSTPTARTRTPCANQNPNSNLTGVRSNSRSSTPTRRTPAAQALSITRSYSVDRGLDVSNNNAGHVSRPSSPALRSRAPVQASPSSELRTKPVERALSAGRQRPGSHYSSSILPEAKSAEKKRPSTAEHRLVKQTASSPESNGFGRTISKKSMDMALKHMDIKNTMVSTPGASVFPRSIRSAAMKGREAGFTDQASLAFHKGTHNEASEVNSLKINTREGNIAGNDVAALMTSNKDSRFARTIAHDIYDSSRYDSMLLQEDSKNMVWLHSIEDLNNQTPLFDHRFATPLPEPFGLI